MVDRGPRVPDVLHIAISMDRAATALVVPGSHDAKLMRWLKGKNVQVTHGLGETIAQLEREPQEFRTEVAAFIDDLVSHYVLDDGKLVVAHAETCRAEPSDVLFATPYKEVDVTNPESEAAAIEWWEEMTDRGRGGEGMVVKPFDFIATSGRGLVQPAVKCRGREYLRIIYGPEYTLPENLERPELRTEREAQPGPYTSPIK